MAAAGGVTGGFLVDAGACAQMEQQLAITMTKPQKIGRGRKGMRLNESPRIEDTAPRGAAQIAIGAKEVPSFCKP